MRHSLGFLCLCWSTRNQSLISFHLKSQITSRLEEREGAALHPQALRLHHWTDSPSFLACSPTFFSFASLAQLQSLLGFSRAFLNTSYTDYWLSKEEQKRREHYHFTKEEEEIQTLISSVFTETLKTSEDIYISSSKMGQRPLQPNTFAESASSRRPQDFLPTGERLF